MKRGEDFLPSFALPNSVHDRWHRPASNHSTVKSYRWVATGDSGVSDRGRRFFKRGRRLPQPKANRLLKNDCVWQYCVAIRQQMPSHRAYNPFFSLGFGPCGSCLSTACGRHSDRFPQGTGIWPEHRNPRLPWDFGRSPGVRTGFRICCRLENTGRVPDQDADLYGRCPVRYPSGKK